MFILIAAQFNPLPGREFRDFDCIFFNPFDHLFGSNAAHALIFFGGYCSLLHFLFVSECDRFLFLVYSGLGQTVVEEFEHSWTFDLLHERDGAAIKVGDVFQPTLHLVEKSTF